MGKISLFLLFVSSCFAQCVLVVSPPSATGQQTITCVSVQKFIGPQGPQGLQGVAGPIGPPGTSIQSTPPTPLPLGVTCPTAPPAALQLWVTFSDGTCGPLTITGSIINTTAGLSFPDGTPVPVGATVQVQGFTLNTAAIWNGNLANNPPTTPNFLISATVQPKQSQ